MAYNHALCWCCAKAVGGCAWSDGLEPVEGWDVVEERSGISVVRCPEFVRDSFGDGLYRDGDKYFRMTGGKMESMTVTR